MSEEKMFIVGMFVVIVVGMVMAGLAGIFGDNSKPCTQQTQQK